MQKSFSLSMMCCQISFIGLILVLGIPNVVLAQNEAIDVAQRKAKVREFCDENPTHTRCEKFLDAEYRRHTDVDRERTREKVEAFKDSQSRGQVLSELRALCRQFPDSPRCNKLRKK